MVTISIGQLRNRLVFQKLTKVADGAGGSSGTYSTDFSLWGKVKQLSDSEVLRHGLEAGYNHFEIWVLFQSDLTPTRQHRITHGSKTLIVNGVNEVDELNRWYKITATEKI